MRDYSEELVQVKLRHAALQTYRELQGEVVQDLLKDVALELQAIRQRARQAIDTIILRACVSSAISDIWLLNVHAKLEKSQFC